MRWQKSEQDAKYITNHVLQILPLKGIKAWRQNNLAVRGRKFTGLLGVSDVIGYQKRGGRFVAVEVKGPKDTLSNEQIEFLESIKKAGGIAIVATSTQQFEKELKEQLQN